jgi:hypothetical protein
LGHERCRLSEVFAPCLLQLGVLFFKFEVPYFIEIREFLFILDLVGELAIHPDAIPEECYNLDYYNLGVIGCFEIINFNIELLNIYFLFYLFIGLVSLFNKDI